MNFLKLIRTASREANALAITSLALLLLKIIFLNRYPQELSGVYELGIIFEAILASVVASYVFYLIVVHIKEQSDRDVLRPYVEKHSKRIVGDCINQLRDISKTSGVSLELTSLSKADILTALSKIAPYSQAPLLISTQPMQYANWFQYFTYYEQHSRSSIRKLLDQLQFLEAPLVVGITEIDDCTHFSQLSLLQGQLVKNPDLSAWANPFYAYCMHCRDLDLQNVRLGFASVLS